MASVALVSRLPSLFGHGAFGLTCTLKKKAAVAALLVVASGGLVAQTAYRPPLSVPPTFYDLQGLSDSFNMQNSIMNAGITAAIKMNKARLAALSGQLHPQGGYLPSVDVTRRVLEKRAADLGGFSSAAGDNAATLAEVRAGYDEYLIDARLRNESPDNFVTACAYYVTTALEIEHENRLNQHEQLAIRGDCVTVLAARQQGIGQFLKEADRQYGSQSLAIIAGVAERAYERSGTSTRTAIRMNLERSFHQFFGSNLPEIPVDRLACVGAKSAADFNQCTQVPNARFEAIAHNAP